MAEVLAALVGLQNSELKPAGGSATSLGRGQAQWVTPDPGSDHRASFGGGWASSSHAAAACTGDNARTNVAASTVLCPGSANARKSGHRTVRGSAESSGVRIIDADTEKLLGTTPVTLKLPRGNDPAGHPASVGATRDGRCRSIERETSCAVRVCCRRHASPPDERGLDRDPSGPTTTPSPPPPGASRAGRATGTEPVGRQRFASGMPRPVVWGPAMSTQAGKNPGDRVRLVACSSLRPRSATWKTSPALPAGLG